MKYLIVQFVLLFFSSVFAQPIIKIIETQTLIQDSLFFPSDLAYADGWLFAKAEMSEYGIVIINPDTGEFEYQFGKQGRGPAEYSNNFTIQRGPGSRTLEVSDTGNRKNDIYSIDCLKEKPIASLVHTCIINSAKIMASRQALILDNKTIVNHGSTPDGILFLSKGNLKLNYLDTIPQEIKSEYKKPIHSAFAMTGRIAASSDRTKFAYFADSYDRILFFDKKGDEVALIKEKKFTFLPQFNVKDFGSSSYMEASDDYKGAFYSPITRNESYYVLFSGKTSSDINQKGGPEWRASSNRIKIYNYSGVEKGEIILDKDVFVIELTENENQLFAMHINQNLINTIIKAEIEN